jgi:hypothetical protein
MRMLFGLACKGRFIYIPCIRENYSSILIFDRQTFAQIVHNHGLSQGLKPELIHRLDWHSTFGDKLETMSNEMERYLKQIMFRYGVSEGIAPTEMCRKLEIRKEEMNDILPEFHMN